MNRRHYPAVFERAADGGLGVFFPDLPGCTSGGRDMAEAMDNAEEALALWVESATADGEDLPKATPLEKVKPGRGVKAAAIQLVGVDIPRSEPAVKIAISMDAALLRRLDAAATKRGATRSGLLAEGARRVLAGRS
ncbi:MAG: hypothetical protein FJX47_10630 [Alphaproteobacteria bacterium]|nr:hypothetical protein [Alphaproteobacteria bacterium]